MSCPKCEHTMQNLWVDPKDKRIFWCPRCGTIKVQWIGWPGGQEEVVSPKMLDEGAQDSGVLDPDFDYPTYEDYR